MSEMFPSSYGVLYKTPDYYKQPQVLAHLPSSTQYPNLNSREYATRPYNIQQRIHPAWECLAVNNEGIYALASNKLTGREWYGTLWGFPNVDSIGSLEQSTFKLKFQSIITALQYIDDITLIMTMRSGCIHLWSLGKNPTDGREEYPHLLDKNYGHTHPILCLDQVRKDVGKVITGGKDCTLKIWDVGSGCLSLINTIRYAHSDFITGIATSSFTNKMFVTCSLDKSVLLWDERRQRPASAIIENYDDAFKTISWAQADSQENFIYVGGEDGQILLCDIRKPHEPIKIFKFSEKAVRKIVPKNTLVAVIGDNNVVKVFNQDVSIYESSEATNIIRDAVWNGDDELLTVGFDGKLWKHIIPV